MLATATHMFQNIDCIRKNKWRFFVRERNNLIFYLNTKQYLLLVMVFILCSFRIRDFVVTQSSQGKRRKHKETVIFDLELISDSNCCYHRSMDSTTGSRCVPPPCKNIFSLVHQPIRNMIVCATGQPLLPLVFLKFFFHYDL